MREFQVLERQKDYFICTIKGMHCRLVIDEYSQNLTLGMHTLHVEEITDRYEHFAKDAVFRLTLPLNEQDSIAICTLATGRKNRFTYKKCLRLGGKWEPILNEWVFSASVQEQVEALRKIVQSPPKLVEVTFHETITMPDKTLSLFGFELVKGMYAHRIPMMHKGVQLKGGDVIFVVEKPMHTIALPGTIVRLHVPESMIEDPDFREDYFGALSYRIIKQRVNR
ncbi:hypothetical protein EJ063_12065 [Vibrio aquaticus]|uniref:Uncharacterized protein n=1 Tax=Vibrio aquaticus TaxID=2496559 RepID=A0A3S0Q1L9_9VIBR|nr:hypothetical protein [Vibrio aquaticus]RTZ15802.1 hypothetical protein EJ063_12065 [Vibrio aquaticus]